MNKGFDTGLVIISKTISLCVAICISIVACSSSAPKSSSLQLDQSRPASSIQNISIVEDTKIQTTYPAHVSFISPEVVANQEEPTNLIENTQILSFRVHTDDITAIAISRDGSRIFTAANDGNVKLHLVHRESTTDNVGMYPSYLETKTLFKISRSISSISLSPDEKMLAVGGFSYVAILSLETMEKVGELTQLEGRINTMAWDPRGESLALGRAAGDVYVWRLGEGEFIALDNAELLERYARGLSPVSKVIFHPSSRVLIVADRAGVISVWRLLRTEKDMGLRDEAAIMDQKREGGVSKVIVDLGVQVDDMTLSPDGNELIVAGWDGKIRWWKIRGLKSTKIIESEGDVITGVSALSISDNKTNRPRAYYATVSRDQRIKLWCDITSDPKSLLLGPNTEGPMAVSINEGVSFKADKGLLSQTPIFDLPLGLIVSQPNSSHLWVAQKTGNLLSFDARSIINSRDCPIQ